MKTVPAKVTLEGMWQVFAGYALKNIVADSIQYKEMKKAFICGAVDMLHSVAFLSSKLTEEAAAEVLDSLMKEGQDFITSLQDINKN